MEPAIDKTLTEADIEKALKALQYRRDYIKTYMKRSEYKEKRKEYYQRRKENDPEWYAGQIAANRERNRPASKKEESTNGKQSGKNDS